MSDIKKALEICGWAEDLASIDEFGVIDEQGAHARGSIKDRAVTDLAAKVVEQDAKLTLAESALETANREMDEIDRIADEALESDDYQAHFSQRNYMTGPALRGDFERIATCVTRFRAAQKAGGE